MSFQPFPYFNVSSFAINGGMSVQGPAVMSTLVVTNQFLFSTIPGQPAPQLNTAVISSLKIQTSTLNFVDITNSASVTSLYNQAGILYYNGAPVGGSGAVSSNLGLSNLELLGTLSTSSTFTNFVSSAQLQTSTLNLRDTTNTTSVLPLYNQGGSLYFNGSAVGSGSGSVSSNLGLSNLNVLNTLSTSSTFTNFVSSAQLQTSTLNLLDTTNPSSVLPLYNQGGSLYFNGSAVGGSVSSNYAFSNLTVSLVLTTLSTKSEYVSTPLLEVDTIQYNRKIYLSNTNNNGSIAIGYDAGTLFQQDSAIAIGGYAGRNAQHLNAIAIGGAAGYDQQDEQAIAIGITAGQYNQYSNAIAIGSYAGNTRQSSFAIAIGANAGYFEQGVSSIAIGVCAGRDSLGDNAIAIGAFAGSNGQATNSIVLNATGSNVSNTQKGSFTVKPVRNATGFGTQMNYDLSSGEITYGTPSDSNLKENIVDTSNYFEPLLKLRPVEYSFKEDVSSIRHLGFIAQEIQPLLPALVEQHNSTLYINYNAFHPMYITAFQSLQSTNQGLQQQLFGTQQQLQQQITENRILIQTLFSTLHLSI